MQIIYPLPSGWRLFLFLTAALTAAVFAGLWIGPEPVEATRAMIRLTARTSLVLFSLAFVASSLHRLLPSARWALWIRNNRRFLGLTFLVSHLLHAAMLVRLALLDPVIFDALTTPVSFIAGGTGYAVILLMAASSFEGTRSRLGERAWTRFHSYGSWAIWLFFLINFGKRAAFNWMYWPAMTIIFVVLAIRLLGRSRKSDMPVPNGPVVDRQTP